MIGGLRRSALLGLACLVPWALAAAGVASSNVPSTGVEIDKATNDKGQYTAAAPGAGDIRFFVVVKSSNYAQKAGELTLLNYHFFSEVFPARGVAARGTLMSQHFDRPKTYEEKGDTLYVEGGHLSTLAALDAAYPNGVYRVSIDGPQTHIKNGSVDLRGDSGATEIPEPIHISIAQDGKSIDPGEIAPSKPTTIRWNRFSNGHSDPRGIVDDMIFVVIQDCHGRNVYHSGLPFSGKYLRYNVSEVQVPAHLLEPGQPYSMFVEMPHVADSTRAQGIPGFASFATATYLDLRTLGTSSAECPAAPPPMDTGQTDRSGSAPATGTGAVTAIGKGTGTGAAMGKDGGAGASATTAEVRIIGQVTFLYYRDLAAPREFYGKVLGLVPYLDNEWVTLYHTASGASIGLVKSLHSHANPATKRAVVMVSLVTDDVAGWYRKLRHNGKVRIVKAPYDHPGVPIRAFEVEDPAGYPIEFFQWLDPAAAKAGQSTH